MIEEIFKYVVAAGKGTLAEFQAAFPEPVFLVQPFAEASASEFVTMAGAAASGRAVGVARVRKREGANAFALMVTIGRARNNDIEVRAPDVSKFHAFLRAEPDGSWSLTDAGSSYGSFVRDVRLAPNKDRASLRSGAEVRLGSVRLTFYSSEEFYAYLLRDDA